MQRNTLLDTDKSKVFGSKRIYDMTAEEELSQDKADVALRRAERRVKDATVIAVRAGKDKVKADKKAEELKQERLRQEAQDADDERLAQEAGRAAASAVTEAVTGAVGSGSTAPTEEGALVKELPEKEETTKPTSGTPSPSKATKKVG